MIHMGLCVSVNRDIQSAVVWRFLSLGHVCSSARLYSCLLVYAFDEPLDDTDPAAPGGRVLIDPCGVSLRWGKKDVQRRKRAINVINGT